MAWYWAISISIVWLTVVYVWGFFGIYAVERSGLAVDDNGKFDEWSGWMFVVMGLIVLFPIWPMVAIKLGLVNGLSWYWWLLIVDIIGLPWSLPVAIGKSLDHHSAGYLFLGLFWPFQWMAEYTTLE